MGSVHRQLAPFGGRKPFVAHRLLSFDGNEYARGVEVRVHEDTEGMLTWTAHAPTRVIVVLSGPTRLRQTYADRRSDALAFRSTIAVHPRGSASSCFWTSPAKIAVVELPCAFITAALQGVPRNFCTTVELARDDAVVASLIQLLADTSRGESAEHGELVWSSLSTALIAHLAGDSTSPDASQAADRDSTQPPGAAGNGHAIAKAPALSRLMESAQSPEAGQLARWQERLAKTKLSEVFPCSPSIAIVAAACGLSRGHFSKAFKRSTGHSPHQWLVRLRVETAKGQLLHSDQSIAEVAVHCGFSDQSHLTRTFVRLTGVTPGRWQRMHRS